RRLVLLQPPRLATSHNYGRRLRFRMWGDLYDLARSNFTLHTEGAGAPLCAGAVASCAMDFDGNPEARDRRDVCDSDAASPSSPSAAARSGSSWKMEYERAKSSSADCAASTDSSVTDGVAGGAAGAVAGRELGGAEAEHAADAAVRAERRDLRHAPRVRQLVAVPALQLIVHAAQVRPAHD
ncbi:MAG: hypothetical protein VXW43_19800, partial [Pseudomonadota bacterium]|nr:hypothetical protein [Pseudomonadota bacterium]